jgi:hypothetical protein
MGNSNTAKVMGKWTVELQFTSGKKLILVNVLYVPEIRKNLVSANLLCKKGVKAVIESDNLILSTQGVFVGKWYSCDGMYKLSINNINSGSTYIIESSILWHNRLIHLNFRSLKFMFKHGLISYNHNHSAKCEICIQAKMTKKLFSRTNRNSKLLELVHYDVCEINGVLTRGGNIYFITFTDDFSRYTNNPSTEHWKAISRIIGFLKRTIELGLCYTNFPSILEGYTDASWITSASDNKATSRWVFTLGGGVVSWASKKQTCISHSTMESEFIALAAASKEAEWLRYLLLDIKLCPQLMPAISLPCDNEATMSRAYSKVYNGKSRHISLRHEYVKQLIIDDIITIVYVRSSKNLADPFTKGLLRDLVKNTSGEMGLKPFFKKSPVTGTQPNTIWKVVLGLKGINKLQLSGCKALKFVFSW